MNTIDAYQNDVLLQIPYLQEFTLQKQLSEKKQQNTIFCGRGDSLAAAILAESFSNFKVRAIDPLDLSKNSSIIKNNQIYIISISGNTVSNVKIGNISKNLLNVLEGINLLKNHLGYVIIE